MRLNHAPSSIEPPRVGQPHARNFPPHHATGGSLLSHLERRKHAPRLLYSPELRPGAHAKRLSDQLPWLRIHGTAQKGEQGYGVHRILGSSCTTPCMMDAAAKYERHKYFVSDKQFGLGPSSELLPRRRIEAPPALVAVGLRKVAFENRRAVQDEQRDRRRPRPFVRVGHCVA